ncbi:hypothetical protein [Acinetobacter indicus]|uniref:hypothetical protein n=1 Tax=Acinetobacter indicus TaxID=756892 RepID=UPI000CEB3979|nr:hypothetical protein [Acinetobacter indicus]AVH14401.1 hypothetical protein CTZ23_08935 [Acinetobacter indicus]
MSNHDSPEKIMKGIISLQNSLVQHLQSQIDELDDMGEAVAKQLDECVEDLHELLRFIVDRKLICIACDAFVDNKRISDRLEPYYEEYMEGQKVKETRLEGLKP